MTDTCEDGINFFDEIGSGCAIEVACFGGVEAVGLVVVGVVVLDERVIHGLFLPHSSNNI